MSLTMMMIGDVDLTLLQGILNVLLYSFR